MQTVELVRPTSTFRESYCGLVTEFSATGEKLVPFTLAFEHDDFDAFLDRLDACARGIDLPDGFVAHSTFWLVRNQGDVGGVSNIRHSLTAALHREGGNIGYGIRPSARRQGLGTTILQKSLACADELGLTRVLVTCAKANIGSAKSILRNGVVLESEEYLPERGEIVQRYWIESGSNAGGPAMRLRAYCDDDWSAVRDIYDLAEPDEMRGVVTLGAILPLDCDPEMRTLFRESQILVMRDENHILGYGGSKQAIVLLCARRSS
jgi:predicted acetyltransferase